MYRAVGKRCAVDFETLKLPISRDEALSILQRKSFVAIEVDIIALARVCVGKSRYRRGASMSQATEVVDCSSLTKWDFGQLGIWLSRRPIQQRECGEKIRIEEIKGKDLVFTPGAHSFYLDDPEDGVGHVGIATDEGTVIHAAGARLGVVETPLSKFAAKGFRGVRRIIAIDSGIITLVVPASYEIETSDDIKWIILKELPR